MADESHTPTTDPPAPEGSGDAGGSGQPAKADLGILLVHGIGEQAQGETLTKFAEPIVDWMRDWLHRESAKGSLVASTPIDAVLRPPLLPPGTPAHARVLIGGARDDARDQVVGQEWLFAEAWWGPQVLTPPISSFTMWLVTRGPWLMLFHFNQRLLVSPTLHDALEMADRRSAQRRLGGVVAAADHRAGRGVARCRDSDRPRAPRGFRGAAPHCRRRR